MPRQNSNFQVTELLDDSGFSSVRSNFNNFGNFVYKDHVTRKKYDVNHLKTSCSANNSKDNSHQYLTHKSNKSLDNSNSILKNSNINIMQQDNLENKKWELSHFLQQLVMMNHIRNKRNFIVSRNEKAQKRKSLLPITLPQIKSRSFNNIDSLKQQVRRQVHQLNTQLFRQYLFNKQSYHTIFGQLNNASNKGALNTNKIKQIKNKIKECSKAIKQQGSTVQKLIKRTQLQYKQNQFYESYFNKIWKDMNEQIHLKMKHEASYNWKYGKMSTVDQIVQNYGHQKHLDEKR